MKESRFQSVDVASLITSIVVCGKPSIRIAICSRTDLMNKIFELASLSSQFLLEFVRWKSEINSLPWTDERRSYSRLVLSAPSISILFKINWWLWQYLTVLIRYKSWQSQLSRSCIFVSTGFSFVLSLFFHIMHINYMKFIFYLHSKHTEARDILFIKFFILKYGSSSSTWNNFISPFSLAAFSLYGVENLCNILVFMETFALFFYFSRSLRNSTEKQTNRRRCLVNLFIILPALRSLASSFPHTRNWISRH